MHMTDTPREPATLSCDQLDGLTLLTLSGDLDLASVPLLRERLNVALRDTAPLVVIDLAGVTFCDASGLAVLVGASRRTAPRGVALVLTAPRPQVAKLLSLTGLDRAFVVHRSIAEARLDRIAA